MAESDDRLSLFDKNKAPEVGSLTASEKRLSAMPSAQGLSSNHRYKKGIEKQKKGYNNKNNDQILERRRRQTIKRKKNDKEYYFRNKDRINRQRKIYYQKNKERIRATQKKWRENNPEKQKAINRKGYPERRKWHIENVLGTWVNGKKVWIRIKKRPQPFPLVCELCKKPTKRLNYHHWDDKNFRKAIWLCCYCHCFVERWEHGFLPKYIHLKKEIERDET